jgi:hypothetical protein
MKTIKKDELFGNLSRFLKTKGVELKEGVYSQRVNRACNLLTDAINVTQKTVGSARVKADKKLEQLRQTIHEATAPSPAPAASPKKSPPAGGQAKKKQPARSKPAKASPKSTQDK